MDKSKLEYMNSKYFMLDLPCPFKISKGGNVLIYPISFKDYQIYNSCRDVMEIRKNELNDINFIKMSYIQFLYEVAFQENPIYKDKFIIFIELILKEQYMKIEIENQRYFLSILEKEDDETYTRKYIISSKELEEICTISFFQNDINYDDTYYNPEIRQVMEDYYRLKYGTNSIPSLEKQRAYVTSKTGILPNVINEMTYRSFNQIFKACVDSEIYMSRQILKSSTKFDIKENIVHPLYEKEKNKLEEVFSTSSDELRQKIH